MLKWCFPGRERNLRGKPMPFGTKWWISYWVNMVDLYHTYRRASVDPATGTHRSLRCLHNSSFCNRRSSFFNINHQISIEKRHVLAHRGEDQRTGIDSSTTKPARDRTCKFIIFSIKSIEAIKFLQSNGFLQPMDFFQWWISSAILQWWISWNPLDFSFVKNPSKPSNLNGKLPNLSRTSSFFRLLTEPR